MIWLKDINGIGLEREEYGESDLDDSSINGWEHFAKLLQLFANKLNGKVTLM